MVGPLEDEDGQGVEAHDRVAEGHICRRELSQQQLLRLDVLRRHQSQGLQQVLLGDGHGGDQFGDGLEQVGREDGKVLWGHQGDVGEHLNKLIIRRGTDGHLSIILLDETLEGTDNVSLDEKRRRPDEVQHSG